MAKTTEIPKVPVVEFEVADGGTLLMANYDNAETRGDFDEYVPHFWHHSPQNLADAMDECRPLAWVVNEIYSGLRADLTDDLRDEKGDDNLTEQRRAALTARLETLPEEPEEGAVDWLLGLTRKEFDHHVVSEIDKWLNEPPDWRFEGPYLPESCTAQGAALEYFQRMAIDQLDILGVYVVEGEHPGSSYYAAELTIDIDIANRRAEAAAIPVRFVAASD